MKANESKSNNKDLSVINKNIKKANLSLYKAVLKI